MSYRKRFYIGDFYINGDDLSSSFSIGEEEGKKHPSTGCKRVLGSVRWERTAYQKCVITDGKIQWEWYS